MLNQKLTREDGLMRQLCPEPRRLAVNSTVDRTLCRGSVLASLSRTQHTAVAKEFLIVSQSSCCPECDSEFLCVADFPGGENEGAEPGAST